MILSVLEKTEDAFHFTAAKTGSGFLPEKSIWFYIEFCDGSRFTQLFMELIYLYIVAISLWFFNPATMPTSLFNSCLQRDWMIEIMY